MIRRINHYVLILLIIFSSNIVTANNSCGTPDVLTFGTTQTNLSAVPYWDAVPGAISYNLKFRKRNVSAQWSAPLSTNTNSLALTNLAATTNYEFIVQTVCALDSSLYSSAGWFTTASS